MQTKSHISYATVYGHMLSWCQRSGANGTTIQKVSANKSCLLLVCQADSQKRTIGWELFGRLRMIDCVQCDPIWNKDCSTNVKVWYWFIFYICANIDLTKWVFVFSWPSQRFRHGWVWRWQDSAKCSKVDNSQDCQDWVAGGIVFVFFGQVCNSHGWRIKRNDQILQK